MHKNTLIDNDTLTYKEQQHNHASKVSICKMINLSYVSYISIKIPPDY